MVPRQADRCLTFEILNKIASAILADNYFYLYRSDSFSNNWGKWKPRQSLSWRRKFKSVERDDEESSSSCRRLIRKERVPEEIGEQMNRFQFRFIFSRTAGKIFLTMIRRQIASREIFPFFLFFFLARANCEFFFLAEYKRERESSLSCLRSAIERHFSATERRT